MSCCSKGWYLSPGICLDHLGLSSWSLRGPFALWRDILHQLSRKSVHLPDSKCKWKPGTLDTSGQKLNEWYDLGADRIPHFMLKFPLISWRILRLGCRRAQTLPVHERGINSMDHFSCLSIYSHSKSLKMKAPSSMDPTVSTQEPYSLGWLCLAFTPLSVMASECFKPISVGLGEVLWCG